MSLSIRGSFSWKNEYYVTLLWWTKTWAWKQRAATIQYQKEPDVVVWASVQDISLVPPKWGASGMSYWKEAQGQTQDMM